MGVADQELTCEYITPETATAGDQVMAVEDMKWSGMPPGLLDFVVTFSCLGRITGVNVEKGYIMVEWDEAPMLKGGKRQVAYHHYLPDHIWHGWSLLRVREQE